MKRRLQTLSMSNSHPSRMLSHWNKVPAERQTHWKNMLVVTFLQIITSLCMFHLSEMLNAHPVLSEKDEKRIKQCFITLVVVRIATNIAKIKSLVRSYPKPNLMLTKANVKLNYVFLKNFFFHDLSFVGWYPSTPHQVQCCTRCATEQV